MYFSIIKVTDFGQQTNVLYTTLAAGEFRSAGSAAPTSKFQFRFGTYLALEKIQV